MAVTLIVETGAIIANSNSYASEAEYEAYYEAHLRGAAMLELEDDEIKQLLIMATRAIDAGIEFKGSQVSIEQTLEWPRFGVTLPYDPNVGAVSGVATGNENIERNMPLEYPSNEIPKKLKDATIELCRFLYASDRDVDADTAAVKREKVDAIETEYFAGTTPDILPESVVRLLRVLTVSAPSTSGPAPATGGLLVRR